MHTKTHAHAWHRPHAEVLIPRPTIYTNMHTHTHTHVYKRIDVQIHTHMHIYTYMIVAPDFLQASCEHLICQIPWLHSVFRVNLCPETLWPVQGQRKMWCDTSPVVPPTPSKPAVCSRLCILRTASLSCSWVSRVQCRVVRVPYPTKVPYRKVP